VNSFLSIKKKKRKEKKRKMADNDQYGEGMERSVKYIPWKEKNQNGLLGTICSL